MNPFQYGSVVRGDHFCNRKREIQELRNDIENGLNVLIYAPRRFGKTSLVQEAVTGQPYLVVFFDLMRVVDPQEFAQAYFRSISKSIERSADRVVRTLRDTLQFRPQFSATFDRSGSPTFSLTIMPGEEAQVLEEVLALPLRIAKQRKKRVLVVFDEFQEISRLGIEGTVRSAVQHHGDQVSYLFMGSKKTLMEQLFLNRGAPFFQSVKHLPINPIDAADWRPFLHKQFERADKTISDGAIEAILSLTQGFPHYTQQIAYELFQLADHHAIREMVQEAIDSVIAKEEDLFLLEWDTLGANQKKALRLVAQAGPEAIFAKATLTRYRTTASSLKKAVDGLIAKDLVDRTPGGWFVQDPLFAHYVRTRL